MEFGLRAAKLTRDLFEACTDGVEPRRVQYLTEDQWLELAELYRADMEVLGKHLALSFPVNLKAPQGRPFLPEFSRVPEKVKSDALKNLSEGRYLKRLDPALIELLRQILDRKATE